MWQLEHFETSGRETCKQLEESDFGQATGEPNARPGADSARERALALVNRLSGSLLHFSSRFCQIDVAATRGGGGGGHSEKRQQEPGAPGGPSRGFLRGLLHAHWPKLVFLANAYCMLKLTLNVCFQYEHDGNLLLLEWSREHPLAEGGRADRRPEALLLERLEASRRRLKSIGAPHIGGSIAIELTYITILLLCATSYLLGQFYFRYVDRFDLYLVRALLDRRAEARRCNRLILLEANKFLESRRIQLGLWLDSCKGAGWAVCQQHGAPGHHATARALAHKLLLDHQLVVRQLKLMARCGALVPLNRTPEWINLMSLIYCLFTCGSFLWSVLFDVALCLLLPKLANFQVEWEPMDLVFNLELLIIASVCVVSLLFYLATCAISCLDQARLIFRIRGLILDCIHENARIYRSLHAADQLQPLECPFEGKRSDSPSSQKSLASSASWQTTSTAKTTTTTTSSSLPSRLELTIGQHYRYAQLNANLLHIIMHYKIFVAQLRPVLRAVAFVAFVAVSMMLLHPALTRLHTPYVASAELKSRYYILSLISAFFVNLNILPMCYINSRCLDLYRALFSLLAHTIELELLEELKGARIGCPHRFEIYDAHSISALQRELKSSRRFVRQFETRAFGLNFTYANLLRIYFWIGLISLSILAEDSGGAHPARGSAKLGSLSAFERILQDPFGFYAI